jgi:hypothetical protein
MWNLRSLKMSVMLVASGAGCGVACESAASNLDSGWDNVSANDEAGD